VSGVIRRPPIGPDAFAFETGIVSAVLDRNTEALVIDGLTVISGGIDARLELRGDAMLSDPRLSGTATLESARIDGFFDALGLEPPIGFGQAPGGIVAAFDFDAGVADRTVSIGRYALSALGINATGQAELGSDGTLVADIDVPAFRPGDALIGSLGATLPEGVDLTTITSAELAASLVFATGSGRVEIGEYSIRLDTASANGSLTIDDVRSPERLNGNVTVLGLDNRLLGALFGAWLPESLVDAELGEFRLVTDFAWRPASRTAEFAPLTLSAYGLTGDGQLLISNAGGSFGLSGRAELAEFSPRVLFARFNLPVPQSADPSVLRSAELAASFDATNVRGEFRDIAITLDDSRITGEFSVEDFADPAYEFVLRADRINVDRYLPPRGTTDPEAEASNNERVLGGMRLASESMTGTVVDGVASVGRLTIGGMDFSQLSTGITLGDGRAALSSVRTELYGGEFDGGLSIDATGETGTVRLTGNTTNVAIEPLLTAMLGSAYISGSASFTLDLTGRGDTINEVLQSAAGSLDFSLANGEIDGTNLGFELCRAVNAVRNLRPPAASPDSTAFSIIRGSAVVSDGVATSSDLYATTGYLELTGRGRSRIVDQWIDHRYRAALTGPIPIAGCDDVNRSIANDPVPINFGLTGSFPDIEFNVDRSQLLEDWVRREARERVEERLQDAILDRIFN
jgi:AsmA protein